MAGRQLPFVSLLVPAWLVVTMSGWRGLRGAWPAVLVCGGSFAIVQFLWSNYVGPELVDIMGGLVSLGSLALFCTWWKPAEVWDFPVASGRRAGRPRPAPCAIARADARARVDAVGLPLGLRDRLGHRPDQGVPQWRAGRRRALYRAKHVPPPPHAVLSPAIDVPGLHRMVYREHPVEVDAVDRSRMHDAGLQGQARRGGALHVQLALGHRHRHSLRRARDGALPAHSRRARAADGRHDAPRACAGRS